jgi:MFS transporter, ACS family, glucarate transporter
MSGRVYNTEPKRSKVRWLILLLLFIVTTLNYADRATLSIAGTPMASELSLDDVSMGYVFSAFGWAYVIAQLPGGWFLDRFGSKRVYTWSILLCAVFNLLQGFVDMFSAAAAVVILFVLRFLAGLAQAPAFPGNSRIVASWFPVGERGTASSIFSSAQYFATVAFAPLVGWFTSTYGWKYVFFFIGFLGLVTTVIWAKMIHSPKEHSMINEAELHFIEQGGALIELDAGTAMKNEPIIKWSNVKQLLQSRMMLGIYLGQYCTSTLTYFFITWFPVYLVKDRGMSLLKAGVVATLPALFGFLGSILGGLTSDWLLRRGYSLSAARKIPIVIGMLLSMSMVICNYITADFLIIFLMSLAFFGKAFGAQGWAVVSDTSPPEISGIGGGLFNTFGNVAGITTPIIIGYIVQGTGSFNGALVFVGLNALVAIAAYLFIVGEIKRVQLH